MIIKLLLEDNPTITSQEKGINRYTGQVYTKKEVLELRETYRRGIIRYMKINRLTVPELKGALRFEAVFGFKISKRNLWGKPKTTKPDLDNAVKLLADVTAEVLGFQDQQISHLVVKKYWSDVPYITIKVGGLNNDEEGI